MMDLSHAMQSAGCKEQPFCECGFARVNVSNDSEITNVMDWIHPGHELTPGYGGQTRPLRATTAAQFGSEALRKTKSHL
ncbi:MAG TPA: hypothetical protein PKA88_23375, partial [Polyangiaceae bacterium]|nr:hypothetical protein [Polyangiaceae bacterium]